MQKKQLGFWTIMRIVMGAQIGTGIMMLPRQLAPFGVWGILGGVITGLGAIVLALIFGVLSSKVTQTGGPHIFILEAFGKRSSFYAAWSHWVMAWVSSIPVIAFGVATLSEAFGPWGPGICLSLELLILAFFMFTNLNGMETASIVEVTMCFLKVAPLLLIPILGFFQWHSDYITVPPNPISSLNSASLILLWGFIGIETGTVPSGDVKNAAKTVPLAIFWGTFLVMIIYTLNTAAVIGILPKSILSESLNPYSDVLEKMFGIGKIAAALIAVVCFGAVNSWLFAASQIALGAANDGVFPAVFARKNKSHSPSFSIVSTSVLLMLGVILTQSKSFKEQIDLLVEFCTVAFLILYFFCVLALAKLMKMGKIKPTSYLWALVILGFVFCTWTLITANPLYLLGALLIPASGFALSKIFKW